MSAVHRRSWIRRATVGVVVIVVGVAICIGLAHTPPARAWLLASILERVAPDGTIAVEELRYNLLTRTVRLDRLRMRATASDEPYFTADAIVVQFPWTALLRPSARRVQLVRPRFSVAVDAEGNSNFGGRSARIESSVPIDRLDLENLSIEWRDDRYAASLTADSLDIRIAPEEATSWLRQGEPGILEVAGIREAVTIPGGTVGWTGVDGLLRQLRIDGRPVAARADGRIESLLADRRLALEAEARLELDQLAQALPGLADTEGTVDLRTEIAGSATEPLINGTLEAPQLRRRQVHLDDVDIEFRWQDVLELDRFVARIAGGMIEGTGRISTDATPSEIRGTWNGVDVSGLGIAVSERPWPDLATLSDGTFEFRWSGLQPEPATAGVALTARLNPTRPGALVGSGELRLDAGNIQGRFEARSLVAPFAAMAPDIGPAAGAIALRGELGGTLEAPRLRGEASVEEIVVSDLPPLSGNAAMTAADGRWALTDATLEGGGLTMQLSAAGDAALTEMEGTADLDAADLNVVAGFAPTLADGTRMPEIAGRAHVTAVFGGSPYAPVVEGTLRGDDVVVAGRAPLTVRGAFTHDRQGTRLSDLEIATGDDRVHLDAEIGPDGRAVEMRSSARIADLGELTGIAWLEPVEELSTRASIRLDTQTAEWEVALNELSVATGERTLRLTRPGRIVQTAEEIRVDDVGFVSGATSIDVAGRLPATGAGGALDVQVGGALEDIDDVVGMLWARSMGDASRPFDATGEFSLRLNVGGSIAAPDPTVTAQLNNGSLRWRDLDAVEGIDVSVSTTQSRMRLETFDATWRGAAVRASGSVPVSFLPGMAADEAAAAADLTAQFLSLGPGVLRGFAPEEMLTTIGASVDATIRMRAPRPEIAALEGELRLDDFRLWREQYELAQVRPTTVELADSTLRIVDMELRTPDADGPALRTSGAVRLDLADPAASAIDLRIAADAALAWFNGLFPDMVFSGSMKAELEAGGTLGAPDAQATIELDNVGVAMRDPRLLASGFTGTVRLDGTKLVVEGLPGYANGGDIMLFANVDLADPQAPAGTLGINGRGVAVQAAGVRASTEFSLTLSMPEAADPVLLGTVTIREGGYRSRVPFTADLLGFAADAGPTTSAESTDFMDRLRYDIRVTSRDDLIVDTQYAEMGIGVDLQVVGAGTRPGAIGEIRLSEGGIVRLGGNTLLVERGSIEFADPRRIEPTLDIQATSRVRSWDISVALLGDAFAPTLEARASDGLTQADALSLLTVGRTIEEAGGAGTEILAEQAFNVVAGRVQGLVGDVGIDSVRFEQAQSVQDKRSFAEPELFPRSTDLAARLSITRSFGEAFELTFSQGLTNSTDRSWIGALKLPWNLRVQGGVYDGETAAVSLEHGFQFGRAANDPRAVRSRAAVVRVDSIRFGGEPQRSEAELLRLLRLRAGSRFDYLAWRGDVDRLGTRYQSEGFYEARIRARREAVGEVDPDTGRPPAYALYYEIDPGPATTLLVEGFEPSASELETLRQEWVDAVAADFLLEDLVGAVRRALVGRGFATAEVTAEFVVDTASERTIRVRARSGGRFGRVETRFDGNDRIGAEELLEHLRTTGLERGAWWNPDETRTEIRAYYRLQGFDDTDVEIGDASFSADRATANVRIVEGQARRVRRVEFAGNAVVDESRLREAVALENGQRLTRRQIESAVAATERLYLELGYNDAVVAVELDSGDRDVVLTLRIDEGPRRILREIRIVGRSHTRERVLNRAIRLRPGDPVILSELQGIRRRLIDTEALASASLEVEDLGPAVDGERPVRLVVTVVEKPLFDLRYGVQALSETLADERRTRPGVSAILAHDNFLGIGSRVSVMGRYRSKEPFARFAISFPKFFGLPVRTTLVAQSSRETIEAPGALAVRREEMRLLAEQRVNVGRLSIGYSYAFERNRNRFIDLPDDSPFQLPAINIARVIPTAIWDGRDDVFAPRRGIFHASTFEFATPALGSELEFWKYTGQQYLFLPIGPVVSASAVRFGAGRSDDPSSTILPRGELYLVGGGTTVRGYPEDALGRTKFFGSFFPGGNAMLIVNQEVRFPIWRWLEGVVFFDAGSAFESVDRIGLNSLAYSTGAGLRLVTPFVLLRLDYGYRLSDVDYLDDDPGRLHFGIGHIF